MIQERKQTTAPGNDHSLERGCEDISKAGESLSCMHEDYISVRHTAWLGQKRHLGEPAVDQRVVPPLFLIDWMPKPQKPPKPGR